MITPLPSLGIFNPAECQEIIKIGQQGLMKEAGLVRGRQNMSIRSARIGWLDDQGDAAWVLRRVMDVVGKANRAHFGFQLSEFAEKLQFAIYDVAQEGHFDWHMDIGGSGLAAQRKLSLVVQLNKPDDYKGGALQLNVGGVVEDAALREGSGLMFPSFVLHRVTPMETGIRMSLTTWVHGPEFT